MYGLEKYTPKELMALISEGEAGSLECMSEMVGRLERAETKLAAVVAAIDAEPELPDDMPQEMYDTLKAMFDAGNRAGIVQALRLIVRETKSGIKDRIRSMPTDSTGADTPSATPNTPATSTATSTPR